MIITVTDFIVEDDELDDGTDYTVRFTTNNAFVDGDGVQRPSGSTQDTSASASGGVLTAPSFPLAVTTDAIVNGRSSYRVTLHKGRETIGNTPLAQNIVVPWTNQSGYTWAELKLFEGSQHPYRDTSVYTKLETIREIDLRIDALGSEPPATTSALGTVQADTTPASAASPVAVMTNSVRVPSPAGRFVFADQFAGASVAAKIEAAIASFAGAVGFVVVPPGLGVGEPASVPDTVRMIDLRGTGGPSHFGPVTTGYLKDILLRARWTAAQDFIQHYQTLHCYANPQGGGRNDILTTKTNYSIQKNSMYAPTRGQHNGVTVDMLCNGAGDAQGMVSVIRAQGGANTGGDEGAVLFRGHLEQQEQGAFTATVSGNAAGVVTYTSPVNASALGEARVLIITTGAKVYSTGTVSAINTASPPVVTGSGTTWATQFGAGAKTNLFFSLDSETQSGLKLVVPIKSIDGETQLTLDYNVAGGARQWLGGTSGTYKIYKGGTTTAVSDTANQVTVSPSADFAVSDTIEQPLAFNFMSGGGVFLTLNSPLRQALGGAGIRVNNMGVLPWRNALTFGGPWDRAIEFTDAVGYGIMFDSTVSGPIINLPFPNASGAQQIIATLTSTGASAAFGYNKSADEWQMGGFHTSNDGRIALGNSVPVNNQLYLYNGPGFANFINLVYPGGAFTGNYFLAGDTTTRYQFTSSQAFFYRGMTLHGKNSTDTADGWSLNGATGAAVVGSVQVGGSSGVSVTRWRHGLATLVAGVVTVSDANVTTNSRIMLTAQDNNAVGTLRVSARTAGVGFNITSDNAGDTGVVAYEIIEP
jgi:hypothetical protein